MERLSAKFTVAVMSVKVLYEIAKQKHAADDGLKMVPLQSVLKMVVGEAKRCGIKLC